MAYCTTADVLKELALKDISGTTDPSEDDVDGYCTDISAELDSLIRAHGVDVPVTDADRVAYLRQVAIYGVAAKYLRSKTSKAGENDLEWSTTFQELYDARRDEIRDNASLVRDDDTPGQPQGTARADTDISFTRTGMEW